MKLINIEDIVEKKSKGKKTLVIVDGKKDLVELWCERGKHNYTRQISRGRRPKNCPLHGKYSTVETQDNVDITGVSEELEEIKNKLLDYVDQYEKLLTQAVKKNEDLIWRKLGNVQYTILNLEARKRYLETLL